MELEKSLRWAYAFVHGSKGVGRSEWSALYCFDCFPACYSENKVHGMLVYNCASGTVLHPLKILCWLSDARAMRNDMVDSVYFTPSHVCLHPLYLLMNHFTGRRGHDVALLGSA